MATREIKVKGQKLGTVTSFKYLEANVSDVLMATREIKVKGQKLGTVTSFKYLEANVSDDGSKQESLSSQGLNKPLQLSQS